MPIKLEMSKETLAKRKAEIQLYVESPIDGLKDPFEEAQFENERIQQKLDTDKRKLAEFRHQVRQRLREFKKAQQQIGEDASLKIKTSNEIKHKNQGESKVERTKSVPNLAILCLNDEHQSEQRKHRISSTRKLYGNIERDKVKRVRVLKKNMPLEDKEILEIAKVEEEKQKKEKERKRVEKIWLKNKESLKQIAQIKIEEQKKELIIDNHSSYKESKKDSSSKMRHIQNSNIDHYIQYLKQMVKDKAIQHKLDLPPLCQCNLESNIWENDWNQCANNCIFYKNPKGISFIFFKSSFVKIILNKFLFKIF
jgi:hypothetical protein